MSFIFWVFLIFYVLNVKHGSLVVVITCWLLPAKSFFTSRKQTQRRWLHFTVFATWLIIKSSYKQWYLNTQNNVNKKLVFIIIFKGILHFWTHNFFSCFAESSRSLFWGLFYNSRWPKIWGCFWRWVHCSVAWAWFHALFHYSRWQFEHLIVL